MQRVEGAADSQPFVRPDARGFRAQWTMEDETAGFVYYEEVKESHCCGFVTDSDVVCCFVAV